MMIIEINDNTTIREISEKFSEHFPHLQIEFYVRLHKKTEMPVEEDTVSNQGFHARVMQTCASDLLEIQPYYKVVDVEKAFRDKFGVSVRVFKKETDMRKQIGKINDLTIKALNEMGRNFSEEFIVSDYKPGLGQAQEE